MDDPKLPIPADDELPEHLSNLTDLQLAFVTNFIANGGKQQDAAEAAGYAPSCAHVTASRLMRNPKILSAIYAESVSQLGRHVPAALAKVARLSSSAKSEYVQLEASRDILDRAGLSAPKEHRVTGGLSVHIDLS